MTILVELFLTNAIKATVLAGVVLSIAIFPKIRNLANLQHSLWCLVLIAMIVPSVINLPVISIPNIAGSVGFKQESLILSTDNFGSPKAELKGDEDLVAKVTYGERSIFNWFIFGIVTLSLSGTGGIIFIAVRRAQLVQRTLRLANFDNKKLLRIAAQAAKILGIKRKVRVAVIQANTSPFIWIAHGSINVAISKSLESSLSDERLLCIMLHELSHYLRRDHWTNTVGFLVVSICWWNPVSWLAIRRMRAIQEYCCDAIAIAKSQINRREYAECLYQITTFIDSRNTCLPASACELFGQTSAEERFKMIANNKVCFETTNTTLFVILLFAAFLPCSIAHSQVVKEGIQNDQKKPTNDSAELKQWYETVEKFNSFVNSGNWPKAEQLANEAASKFGHDDALVQNMLLTSINGMRKSQGLAPIVVKEFVADPKNEEISIIALYSLKDILPEDDAEKNKFVEILVKCISASIADDASEESGAKVQYIAANQGLIVRAPNPRQKQVAQILKQVGKKPKP